MARTHGMVEHDGEKMASANGAGRTHARRALFMGVVLAALSLSLALAGALHAAPGGAAPSAGMAPKAEKVDVAIAPYEIVYDIQLKDVSDRSGILMASGELISKLEGGACEGWTSTSRMKVRFVIQRQGARETESRVSSWESDDGNQYHSVIERYLNDVLMETIRTSASRPRAGVPFVLRMMEPEKRTFTLPPRTLFPTAALKRLLRAARAGKGSLSLLVYEGDKEAAPQHVVAIIGKRQPPRPTAASAGGTEARAGGDKGGKALAALRQKPYWPVALAYYGTEGADGGGRPTAKNDKASEREAEERRFGLPEYEVHFRLYDNGVAGNALLVYPDYVLKAEAKSLRMLPAPACE